MKADNKGVRRASLRACPPPRGTSRTGDAPPAPKDSYFEGRLDLNQYLIKHPIATFYVRVSGDSMTGAGIQPGSILVVDRAVEADDGDIVIARIGDELCVKRLRLRRGRIWLMPENEKYQPIEVIESMDFEVWGRVMHSIRTY